jgi:hypothetical protein
MLYLLNLKAGVPIHWGVQGKVFQLLSTGKVNSISVTLHVGPTAEAIEQCQEGAHVITEGEFHKIEFLSQTDCLIRFTVSRHWNQNVYGSTKKAYYMQGGAAVAMSGTVAQIVAADNSRKVLYLHNTGAADVALQTSIWANRGIVLKPGETHRETDAPHVMWQGVTAGAASSIGWVAANA